MNCFFPIFSRLLFHVSALDCLESPFRFNVKLRTQSFKNMFCTLGPYFGGLWFPRFVFKYNAKIWPLNVFSSALYLLDLLAGEWLCERGLIECSTGHTWPSEKKNVVVTV